MGEHVPPRGLVMAMEVFVAIMGALSLLFWIAVPLTPGGISGVIALVGPLNMGVFGALHIPVAVAGILVWQWRRRKMRPVLRVALEAATIYFCAIVLIGLFFNLLAAQLLDRIG